MRIESNLELSRQQFNNQTTNSLENDFQNLLEREQEIISNQEDAEATTQLDAEQAVSEQDSKEVDEEILSVSKEFESIFVGMMFKQMRDAIDRSDLLDGGLSQDIYEDMYYDELAKQAAKNESFEIAEAVYKQLSGEDLE